MISTLKKIRRILIKLPHAYYEYRQNKKEFSPAVASQIFTHFLSEKQRWSKEYINVVSQYMSFFLKPVVEEFSNKKLSLINNNDSLNIKRERIKIWLCWWQGEDMMPPIVKACFNRIKKIFINKELYEVVLITENNCKNYLDFPEYIWEKFNLKIIDTIKLTDIIRWWVITKYGGCWFDATDYLTHDDPNRYVEKLLLYPFFTARFGSSDDCPGEPSRGKWCNFYFMGRKDNILSTFVLQALLFYWKIHNRSLDYVFLDYIIWIGYSEIPEISDIIDNIPVNNFLFFEFWRHVNETYQTEKFIYYMNLNDFQKISYKLNLISNDENGRETNYGYILKINNVN